MPRPQTLRSVDIRAVLAQLTAADPALGAVIAASPPFGLVPRDRRSPFDELMRAIVYQQLSGQAAGTIYRRFLALYGPREKSPLPEQVMATPTDRMRGVGLSRAKTAAIQDLAAKTIAGVVPTLAEAKRLDDEALIERLVAVRGVGRWTAEMFLMFGLGRADLLPVDDLGVRKGFKIMRGMRKLPAQEYLRRVGKRWAPYRTVASWYCWRACEM
jgi:3-methyladenine DNA glycosylase/8-oxoguanine DNA glycosylase